MYDSPASEVPSPVAVQDANTLTIVKKIPDWLTKGLYITVVHNRRSLLRKNVLSPVSLVIK